MTGASDTPERPEPCSFCGVLPRECPHLGPPCSAAWPEARATRTVPVVAAVVRRGGRILLCRRPAHKRHGGLWEFPGGKLLPNETLGEAVRRELAEELEIDLVVLVSYLWSGRDPGSEFEIHFVEAVAAGDPARVEHDEVAWISPGELGRYELAPGDRSFVERWRRNDFASTLGPGRGG